MRCAWQEVLKLLPQWMRKEVDELGNEMLEELRLRTNMQPELVLCDNSVWLQRKVTKSDLDFVINAASQYSPWAATTISQGYITANGGHRIGFCGDAVVQNSGMTGIRNLSSLCIRIARDFSGIAGERISGSVLIIGRPGSGKTTLLRDLIRQRSENFSGSIAVVDERGEIFPMFQGTCYFPTGRRTDVLSHCKKTHGILTVLRTMGPACIAVDEITEACDCEALINAGGCGVTLMATAHACDKNDLFRRPVYAPIVNNKLFDTLVVMQPDKSWKVERM